MIYTRLFGAVFGTYSLSYQLITELELSKICLSGFGFRFFEAEEVEAAAAVPLVFRDSYRLDVYFAARFGRSHQNTDAE